MALWGFVPQGYAKRSPPRGGEAHYPKGTRLSLSVPQGEAQGSSDYYASCPLGGGVAQSPKGRRSALICFISCAESL